MPPFIDLEPFKAEIISLFHQNHSASDIASIIQEKHHIKVRERTIWSRLSSWGISKRDRTATTNSSLHDRLEELFYQQCLSDLELLRALHEEGYTRGLVRRTDDPGHLLKVYNEGTIQGYGRELLFTYMRGEYLFIPRQRLFNVYRTIAPLAVQQRKNDMQRQRGSYIVPGPDHVWSVDGYMKLEPYVSVVRQYLDTIQQRKIICNKIRSDHGSETSILAEAHHYLRKMYEPEIQPEQCYIFGTSTANQRIESWWSQLSRSFLFRYRNYFRALLEKGDFSKDLIPDQIALYAVYMPILRSQIPSYVQSWNHHNIRKQPERPYIISAETLQWCQTILRGMGFDPEKPPPVPSKEAEEAPFRTIYLGLRQQVIMHMKSHAKPFLGLSKTPTGAFDWIRQQGLG
ncbi:uncharacterized protein BO80DRAFT_451642 [Aspergillus ibericus CBS 121593]|uniref:Uncharacterized protein n=1 Tax=Aspergillus ibericus CBS 121593 TaxID=1448316 RepID=A0A395HBH7_9EURO|nr:hypothetical protein BO80DRAFT_451642 [Aspergillus ibericus CBS 121593]RAL05267.1 hypothetical protein BO80DRAFT_451642 [Aspergillus ibericus CBS 121593]